MFDFTNFDSYLEFKSKLFYYNFDVDCLEKALNSFKIFLHKSNETFFDRERKSLNWKLELLSTDDLETYYFYEHSCDSDSYILTDHILSNEEVKNLYLSYNKENITKLEKEIKDLLKELEKKLENKKSLLNRFEEKERKIFEKS